MIGVSFHASNFHTYSSWPFERDPSFALLMPGKVFEIGKLRPECVSLGAFSMLRFLLLQYSSRFGTCWREKTKIS